MKTQLLENKVSVGFINPGGSLARHLVFDLADNKQRKAMGLECAKWQCARIGNRIVSTVLSIMYAGDDRSEYAK